MKRVAAFFLAAAVACVAVADPKDWYSSTPTESVENFGGIDKDGDGTYDFAVTIGTDGSLDGGDALKEWQAEDPSAYTICNAFENALKAKNEVETLAENLDNAYIPYTDENGDTKKAKLSIASSSGGESATSQFKLPKKITVDEKYLKKTDSGTSEEISVNLIGAETGKAYGITSTGFAEVPSALPDEVHLTTKTSASGAKTVKLKGEFSSDKTYGVTSTGFAEVKNVVADNVHLKGTSGADGTTTFGFNGTFASGIYGITSSGFSLVPSGGGGGVAPDDHTITYKIENSVTNLMIKGAAANQYKCIVSDGADADVKWEYMVSGGDGGGIKTYTEDNKLKAELSGWENTEETTCTASLSNLLTDGSDSKRDNHEVLCRVGKNLHYMPIGVPIKEGFTLLVQGNDGESVTSPAVCTNKLIFATAEDSNVKITAAGDEHGNVTVTFGIYYK